MDLAAPIPYLDQYDLINPLADLTYRLYKLTEEESDDLSDVVTEATLDAIESAHLAVQKLEDLEFTSMQVARDAALIAGLRAIVTVLPDPGPVIIDQILDAAGNDGYGFIPLSAEAEAIVLDLAQSDMLASGPRAL